MLLLLFFTSGCVQNRAPRELERSFYYWKSTFNPEVPEQNALYALHIDRLYIKFFDIVWNEEKNEPMPSAIIKFPQKFVQAQYSIIPTTFITNDCIQKMTPEQVDLAAAKILLLFKNIARVNDIVAIPEIQIDCDWNAGTKEKYFQLLQAIKKLLALENKQLSATVRLYQYKYHKKMGIPPVDRGLLMCYNMGNLKNPATRNSILDRAELKKYMAGFTSYPITLDIALPIFSWKVLFRNKIFTGLISDLPASSLKNNPVIQQSGNSYKILKPITMNGYNFQEKDIIRDEQIPFDDLLKSADIISAKLKTQHLRVALYHLDSITLSKYSINELETIFDHFR